MRFLRDFVELFFPRVCSICGTPLVGDEHEICSGCLLDLPIITTATGEENLVERRYRGRVPVNAATSLLLFSQGGKTQKILHQIKYRGDERLALAMGRQLGLQLAQNELFETIDLMVPVPLFRRREKRRGYNQSLLLCKGIQQTFPRPIENGNLIRSHHTDSQTHKTRLQRMENMKDVFQLQYPERLQGKHILLVDDVITTGATTEACWHAMQKVPGLRLSVASLAITGDF